MGTDIDIVRLSNTMATPTLAYFPIAARGEMARMLAHCGGVAINDEGPGEGPNHAECGSQGSLPVLVHGDFKLSQSIAIEIYIAGLSEKYACETAAHRAKDVQLSGIKDDLMTDIAKVLFDDKNPEKLVAALDKWFPLVEGIIPAEGFVNGLEFPTMADFAVVLMCEGFVPYGAAFKHGNVPEYTKKYAKVTALNERTKADPAVAEWMAKSTSMAGNPFGL